MRTGAHCQSYKAEFFDTRVAAKAILQLNGVAAAGGKLKVTYDIASTESSSYTLGSAAYRSGPFSPMHAEQSGPSSSEAYDAADVFGPVSRHVNERATTMNPHNPHALGPQASTFRKHLSQPLTPSIRHDDPYHGYSLPTTPLHLAAMGRRLSEPGMLADLASRADISARVRVGQGLGGMPKSPSQAIPEQNRVFPERVFNRKCHSCFKFADN